ncbi:MAG: hypothetical protein WD712_00270, partial [Candidatus Spechtbacterales bacterium]
MGTEKDEKFKYKKLSELARFFSYNREYLSKLAREKKIPAKNIGGVWYSTYDGILEYSKITSGQGKTEELAEVLISEKSREQITMGQASELVPYSQDYLALRARQGKLPAQKINGEWHTTAEVVKNYYRLMSEESSPAETKNELVQNLQKFAEELKKVRPEDLKKIHTVRAVATFGYLLGEGYADAYRFAKHSVLKRTGRAFRFANWAAGKFLSLRSASPLSLPIFRRCSEVYGIGLEKFADALALAGKKIKAGYDWLDYKSTYAIKDLIPPREIGMTRMRGLIPPPSISVGFALELKFIRTAKTFFRTSERATKYAFGFALATVLLLSSGSFLAWAINNGTQTLEVFPQKYELSASEGVPDWRSPENILERDLEQTAVFSDFNAQNSAMTAEDLAQDDLTYIYIEESSAGSHKNNANFWEKLTASLGFPAKAVGEEQVVLPNLEGGAGRSEDDKLEFEAEEDEDDLSIFLYKKSIELYGFNIDDAVKSNSGDDYLEIYDASLMLSLASASSDGGSQLLLEWSLGGNSWNTLATLSQNEVRTNGLNEGYYKFPLDALFSSLRAKVREADIESLRVRVMALSQTPQFTPIYIDAVWLEVDYAERTVSEDRPKVKFKKGFNIASDKEEYDPKETPNITIANPGFTLEQLKELKERGEVEVIEDSKRALRTKNIVFDDEVYSSAQDDGSTSLTAGSGYINPAQVEPEGYVSPFGKLINALTQGGSVPPNDENLPSWLAEPEGYTSPFSKPTGEPSATQEPENYVSPFEKLKSAFGGLFKNTETYENTKKYESTKQEESDNETYENTKTYLPAEASAQAGESTKQEEEQAEPEPEYIKPEVNLNLTSSTPEADSPSADNLPDSSDNVSVYLINAGNQKIKANASITRVYNGSQEEYQIQIERPNTFRPGTYTAQIELGTEEAILVFEQDFTWGVLALNFNKSIYTTNSGGTDPQTQKEGLSLLNGDTQAYLQMGVLDDLGHTLCNAKLDVRVVSPSGAAVTFSTEDPANGGGAGGSIQKNPDCAGNTKIEGADYFVYYEFPFTKVGTVPALGQAELGIYEVELTAETENGTRTMRDQFEVREYVPFDVERKGPTRIYPVEPYDMEFTIKANEDFEGQIVETIPDGFKILDLQNSEPALSNAEGEESQKPMLFKIDGPSDKLVWNVSLEAGTIYTYIYTFDAPDISPDFYLLGPLEFRKQETRNKKQDTNNNQDTNSNDQNVSNLENSESSDDSTDTVDPTGTTDTTDSSDLSDTTQESILPTTYYLLPTTYWSEARQWQIANDVVEDVRPNATAAEAAGTCDTTNAHTRLDEDVDGTPDGLVCAADAGSSQHDIRLNFATPTANPLTTTDAQVFAFRAKKSATGGGSPTVAASFYCNGSLVEAGAAKTLTDTYDIFTDTFTFNATSCAASGSDAEVLLDCTPNGGGPNARSCNYESVEWRADVNVSTTQSDFRWRDDSTALNTDGGWLAAENSNSIGNIAKGTDMRLRFAVERVGSSVAHTYRLEWTAKGAGTCASGDESWTRTDTASDAFAMIDGANITNGDAITPSRLSGTGTFVSGEAVDSGGGGDDTADSITITGGQYTEVEFAFEPTTSAGNGTTYCFRVTNAGTAINIYSVYPELKTTPPAEMEITQEAYIFENDDGANVNSNSNQTSTASTAITGVKKGERITARFHVKNTNGVPAGLSIAADFALFYDRNDNIFTKVEQNMPADTAGGNCDDNNGGSNTYNCT